MVGLAGVAVTARAFGAREPRRALLVFGYWLQVGVAISIGLSIPIALVAPWAFAFLGQEPAVTTAAVPYLNCVLASSVMMAAALVIESALRADKNMRTPMVVAVIVTKTPEQRSEGPSGACCYANGECIFQSEIACQQNLGVWQGAGMPCEGLDCVGIICQNSPPQPTVVGRGHLANDETGVLRATRDGWGPQL